MGEVRRAFDELLGRAVAVKMVPHSVRFSAEALRREARALAALNHPAIAAIFDLVSDDDRQYLILELVEGESLGQVLACGRPELALGLSVAAQVARGLEASHGHGMLHRDLKPENVMVTGDGRAKILDFGLAVALTPAGDGGGVPQGPLAGTVTAMSPEQVQRLPLDHRSDLFSFGILLYQLLTGEHPFRSTVPVETMQRILSEDPVPVRQLAPDVGPELEELVGRLLCKNPQGRPDGAGEVAEVLERSMAALAGSAGRPPRPWWRRPAWVAGAAAVVAAGVLGAWVVWARRPPPPLQVAVLRPTFEGGEPGGRPPLAVEAVRAAAVSTLAGLQGVYPIAAHELDAVPGGPAEVARAAAADEVVTTEVTLGPSASRVSMSRLASDGRSTLWMTSFEVPGDDPRLIAETVAANLRQGYRERRVQRGFEIQASPEAYAAFLGVRRDVVDPPADVSWVAILDRLESVRREAPQLVELLTVEASVARYVFESTRDDQYRARAQGLVDDLRRIAPEDPRTLRADLDLQLALRALPAARSALERLRSLDPASPTALSYGAFVAQREGRAAEALEVQRRIAEQRPSWWNLLTLARLELDQGSVERARVHLAKAMARAPDNVLIRAELAHVEMYWGDPERALDLYFDVVAASPQPQYLTDLGGVLLFLGRTREALVLLERAVTAGSRSPFTLLNLADCHSLLGQTKAARELYEEALAGLGSAEAHLSAKEKGIRAQCLAQLGRGSEARSAIAAAMEEAGDSTELFLDAAVVEAVLGDTEAAGRWALRAVKSGASPRYFELPWFDHVRASLGVQTPEGTRLAAP